MTTGTGFRFPEPPANLPRELQDYLNELTRSLQYYDAEIFSQDGGFVFDTSRLTPNTPITSDYTMGVNDALLLVDTTGGDIDITLPDPLEANQKTFIIKKVDSNAASTITVSGTGSEMPISLTGDTNPTAVVYSNGEEFISLCCASESSSVDSSNNTSILQLTKDDIIYTTSGAYATVTGFDTDIDPSSDYTVDSTNGIITFDTAGTYSITYHAVGQQSLNNRTELNVKIQVRETTTFSDVPAARDAQYCSRNSAQDEGSVQINNFLLQADSGDDIRFLMFTAGVFKDFGEDDVRITIIKLNDTGRT